MDANSAEPEPDPAGAGSYNIQTIVIIVLVIIGVVLLLYFIFFLYNIPPAINTPFADGSEIRIKSLANNKYLQVIRCTGEFSSCNSVVFNGICRPNAFTPFTNVLAATAETAENAAVFTLCELTQNPRIQSGNNNAAYLAYLNRNTGTSGISFFGPPNFASFGVAIENFNFATINNTEVNGNCFFWKNQPSNCFCGGAASNLCTTAPPSASRAEKISLSYDQTPDFILQLTLVENNKTANLNTIPTGTYFIQNYCNANEFMFNIGYGSDSLGCPPIITSNSIQDINRQGDKIVQYTFSIEKVGTATIQ